MTTILVPTDFSEIAAYAVEWAGWFSAQTSGRVIFLHAIEPPTVYSAGGESVYANADLEAKYLDYMQKLAADKLTAISQKPAYKPFALKTYAAIGNLIPVIQDTIQKEQIDLLISGTQGAKGWEETLLGSNTEKIVRYAQVPVLSVKQSPPKSIKHIVFTTNLRENQPEVVKVLKKYQTLFGAHLHILFVNTPVMFLTDREIRKLKSEFMVEANFENCTFHHYSEVSEEDGITAFCEDIHADLLAIGTHQRSGITHWIAGSLAERLVNHAPLPVLTFGVK
jgi:nucleotide-binding universal stress UspA family protein